MWRLVVPADVRRAVTGVLVVALLAGCFTTPWPTQTVGAFRLHVAPGDAWLFQDLANETRVVAASVVAALGPVPRAMDVYAYGPDPDRVGGPPDRTPILRSHFVSPASIYLAPYPAPLEGNTLRAPNLSGALEHELIHAYQTAATGKKLPPWVLEGGATLEGSPDQTQWGSSYLEAAHALAATEGATSFD